MKYPVFLKVSTSGKEWNQLKRKIQGYLIVRLGFRRERFGYYLRDNLNAKECAELIEALYKIENYFIAEAVIRELSIDSTPHLSVHIRRPVR